MTTKILRGIIGDGEVEDPIQFVGGESPTITFNEGDWVVTLLESDYSNTQQLQQQLQQTITEYLGVVSGLIKANCSLAEQNNKLHEIMRAPQLPIPHDTKVINGVVNIVMHDGPYIGGKYLSNELDEGDTVCLTIAVIKKRGG